MAENPRREDGPLAVVALNMGGPSDLAGVEPFLRDLFADQSLVRLPRFLRPFQNLLAARVARRRGPEARANYAKIGGASPIRRITEAQAQGVARRLRALGADARPFVAMRYSRPRAADAVAAIKALGASRILALSLYPQYSPATGGSSLADLQESLIAAGLADIPMAEIRSFASEPSYLDATGAMVNEALAAFGEPAPHVLFSAHGLPVAYVAAGDPYRSEIEATWKGVAARLPPGITHSLAFQSRVGPAEWLRPYTDEHLRELAGRGVRRLLMVPLGFVSDHVETLYEMDLLYGGLARSLGIAEFRRVAALNDRREFLDGLGDLAAEALGLPARPGPPAAGIPEGRKA